MADLGSSQELSLRPLRASRWPGKGGGGGGGGGEHICGLIGAREVGKRRCGGVGWPVLVGARRRGGCKLGSEQRTVGVTVVVAGGARRPFIGAAEVMAI
jgi:hypothetical protein